MASRSVDLDQHKVFIAEHLSQFAQMKLLVIGDIGVDEYVTGEVRRISPEAPVPVLEVGHEDLRLGLAGNVAQNITSLGGHCDLIAVVGEDRSAEQLRGLLTAAKVSPQWLVVDHKRPTTRKLRVMAGHHHIVRVDYEQKRHLEADTEKQILKLAKEKLEHCHGVIIQDYAKGVLSQPLLAGLIDMAHAQNKKVLLDPHRSTPLSYYRGADLITPNFEEAVALAKLDMEEWHQPEAILKELGHVLMKATGRGQVVLTRGPQGMRLFEGDDEVNLPTFARQVFDVTGAGDTVIAMLGLAWLSGFSLEQACVAANYAAGVVVGKVGCVPCGLEELREYMRGH